MTEKIAVVVLNYKGIEDTKNSIASLMKQSYTNLTVIAVENGSNDASATELKTLQKKYSDKLQVLYNTVNKGFAGGVNTGIIWALNNNYPYIALFNNDAVADKKWLEELHAALHSSDQNGITTGLLLHADGKTIDSTGEQYSYWGLAFPRNRNDPIAKAPTQPEEVLGATGGATLYKSEVFRRIGLFDETFFVYYEDVDVSLRARLAGWKVVYTPTALAYHKQGATSKRMPSGFVVYHTFKNLPVVFWKDIPAALFFPIGIRLSLAYLLILGNAIKNGQGKAALRGTGKSILLIPYALRQRFSIQKGKAIPVSQLKKLLWKDLPPDQTGLRKFRKFFTGK